MRDELGSGGERLQVIAANVVYHSALADHYDETQPHFRPENVRRVDTILADLAERTGGGSLLDLGCGTGFVLSIAAKYFRRVVGVDLTPAMLAKVHRDGGQVEVSQADTAALPFADETFDVCTAYSFLHHLYDVQPTFAEALRCLRTGGRFFSDADPNRAFWQLMAELRGHPDVDGVVAREARSVLDADEDIAQSTGLAPRTIAFAEFQKIRLGGLDPDSTAALLRSAGFSTVEIRYEWFLGEGKVMHEQSIDEARIIDSYLREMLPATRALFKYVSFRASK